MFVRKKNNCSPKRIVQNSIRGTLLSLSDNYQDYGTRNRTNWRLREITNCYLLDSDLFSVNIKPKSVVRITFFYAFFLAI